MPKLSFLSMKSLRMDKSDSWSRMEAAEEGAGEAVDLEEERAV